MYAASVLDEVILTGNMHTNIHTNTHTYTHVTAEVHTDIQTLSPDRQMRVGTASNLE